MAERRTKWADLPQITAPHNATQVEPAEVGEWARKLREDNERALEEMGYKDRPRGDCPRCATPGQLLYLDDLTEDDEKVCARCIRAVADPKGRQQLCDNDPAHGPAWRNPYTRRNEYFCGRCHAATEEGVVQNRWARVNDSVEARYSRPLGVRDQVLCEARNVPGTKPCKGEVKPRSGGRFMLCNQHAGKTSAADGIWT